MANPATPANHPGPGAPATCKVTAPFRRARSEEQRAARKRAILDTAAAMLLEMPVAEVSLNELSRRVGLAKSNVLRYFESREAVLLELLDTATRDWLDALDARLTATGGAPPARARSRLLAEGIAASLAERPVLCDLISSQAAVLERNVSARVALEYKRAGVASVGVLAELVRRHLHELDEDDAIRYAAGALLVAGAVWSHAHPTAAVLAAYETDPSLAFMRPEFADAVRQFLEVTAAGLLALHD